MSVRVPVVIALVLLAFGGGVYLQHRWPIGTWRQNLAQQPTVSQVTPLTLAHLPAERRLVLLVVGQSNAANYGSLPAQAGPGVYAFAAGRLYAARDPLPGGDGAGGSVWTRLGARLMSTGRYDAVVFAVVARGSSRAEDFAPRGRWHGLLQDRLTELAAAQLAPDVILWQQGETEGMENTTSAAEYAESLTAVKRACATAAPRAVFLVAQATRHADSPPHAAIRLAQYRVAQAPGAAAGPDLDTLDSAWRSDGVHFNQRGLDACAALWEESLLAILPARSAAGPQR